MADPTFASEPCFAGVYACLLRVAVLDGAGVPNPGAGNLFRTDGLVRIDAAEDIERGTRLQLPNGCGTNCVVVETPDKLLGLTLNLTLCKWEPSLIAALTGNATLTASGTAVGNVARSITAATPARVSVEAWSKAWDGNQQAVDDNGALVYWHWAFPSTTWRLDRTALENAVNDVPLVGTGQENANWFDGPGNDTPDNVDVNGMWARWLDTELPSSSCGALTLAAS